MARTKYTVAFPAARPGDEVTWPNTVKVYPDNDTQVPLQSGQSLSETLTFSGWSDATSVTFTHKASGATVTVTTGSPTGTGPAAATSPRVASVVAGTNITVDSTDPANPVVSSSGGSSAVRELVFPFAYDAPGLADTGVVAYTPTPGDSLLDAWVEVDTAWDGTTPTFDLGNFTTDVFGLFKSMAGNAGPIPMNHADTDNDGNAGIKFSPVGSALSVVLAVYNASFGDQVSGAGPGLEYKGPGFIARYVPAHLATADPIKVCVSQDGTLGGGDPVSTQGSAKLHLLVSTPTVSPG